MVGGRRVGPGTPNNHINNTTANSPPRAPGGSRRAASVESGSIYSDFQPSRSPSLVGGEFEARYQFSFEEGSGGSDMDTEITSENSRAPSIFSYDSSRDAPEMLKEENGRTFNNQNNTYYLPADEREFSRLALQHQIHKQVLNGLYPAADLVERALAPEWGVEKAILDVGTGPGHWAIDMAKRFPHCHVVGVDLAPRTSFSVLPENLRLEFDDANLGFPHYHGCFDLVHARSITTGINDYDAFVTELARCLRPGGVMVLVDGEPPVLGSNKLSMQPAPTTGQYPETKGWFARILYEASRGMVARGGRVLTNSTAALNRAMLAAGTLDPPVVYTMYMPLGPWPVGATEAETRWIRQIGEMMRQNALEFMHTLRPMLKTQGFEDGMIDKFMAGATAELTDLTVHMYTRWAYGYAVKPLNPGGAHAPPAT